MEFNSIQHYCPINVAVPEPSLRHISRNVTQSGASALHGDRAFLIILRVLHKQFLVFSQDIWRSFSCHSCGSTG
jgi:hypothetical protein